jgi:hypothetical protein
MWKRLWGRRAAELRNGWRVELTVGILPMLQGSLGDVGSDLTLPTISAYYD